MHVIPSRADGEGPHSRRLRYTGKDAGSMWTRRLPFAQAVTASALDRRLLQMNVRS